MTTVNLEIAAGSIGRIYYWNGNQYIELEDVELERLLDDIGPEAVMKHFGLKPKRENYGVRNEDF